MMGMMLMEMRIEMEGYIWEQLVLALLQDLYSFHQKVYWLQFCLILKIC